jgi:DNA-binding MarR family transcriptional regulator
MATDTATGSIVLLTRLARVVYRRSTVELVGMGLKELGTLAYLRDNGQASSQQGLFEALCIDANSCVLLLNDLERQGYVERRRDPQDRRRHLVSITDDGLEALERAEHAQGSIEAEVLNALSPEQRATLHHLLSLALDGQSPSLNT